MLINRFGNKKQIAVKIQQHFPPHKIYIEPFFGSGGMFFNKPKAKYNFLNDLDSDVFNLLQVVTNNRAELERAFYSMPIHGDLLEYWKNNNETDPIQKALRFIFLSKYTLYGKGETLNCRTSNKYSRKFKYYLSETQKMLSDCIFLNTGFDKFLNSISYHDEVEKEKTLIYADPPYIGTDNNYSHSFKKSDSIELFNSLEQSKCMTAMSEFDNKFIIDEAKDRNLFIHYISERRTIKNRQTEILITNYQNDPKLF